MATESDEIKRARQDVDNLAAEHDRALQVMQTVGAKLERAQQRLAQLLEVAKKGSEINDPPV